MTVRGGGGGTAANADGSGCGNAEGLARGLAREDEALPCVRLARNSGPRGVNVEAERVSTGAAGLGPACGLASSPELSGDGSFLPRFLLMIFLPYVFAGIRK